VFNATSQKVCTVTEQSVVQDVEITSDYHGLISLLQPGGFPTSLEVKNTFKMASDAAIGGPDPNGPSTLQLSGASNFSVSTGIFLNLHVLLGSSTNHDVTGSIDGTVVLSNSELDNFGTLTWAAGDIKVGRKDADITNESGGYLEVKSTGRFWDSTNDTRNVGEFANEGKLHFNTAGVRISADFANDGGIVRVYPGQVQFDFKAEQTGGTFELRNGTVNVSANPGSVLGIRRGLITGAGTITGNLNLGYDGGPATFVTIRPGIDDGVGTIAVSQSWHMFSTFGRTTIRVLDDGSYSKITAGGYAALAGDLWIDDSSNYHPPAGTSLGFLTAASGFRNDFDDKEVAYFGSWLDPNGSGKGVVWSLPPPTATTYSLVAVILFGS
jgi:hypothetical protein